MSYKKVKYTIEKYVYNGMEFDTEIACKDFISKELMEGIEADIILLLSTITTGSDKDMESILKYIASLNNNQIIAIKKHIYN